MLVLDNLREVYIVPVDVLIPFPMPAMILKPFNA